jgi:hypothetical protein
MRNVLGPCAALAIALAAAPAHAQTYPTETYPDTSRDLTPAFPTHGPSPLNQQVVPGTAPATRGWPTNLTPSMSRQSMPAPPRSAARLPPIGTIGFEMDVSPSDVVFQQGAGLPAGVQTATVRSYPNGGVEEYVRIPAGGGIPAHFTSSDRRVTVVHGQALVIEGNKRKKRVAAAGKTIREPAGRANEIWCSDRSECLLYVESLGPLRFDYLNPRAPAF